MNGQIKATAKKVTDILAATTPTAVDADIPPKVLDPKEVSFCNESGEVVQAILLVGGFYTKP